MNNDDLERLELPPLVGALAQLTPHTRSTVQSYGRACAAVAIKADRQRRAQAAEPVAEIVQANEVDGEGNLTRQRDIDYFQEDIDRLQVGAKLYAAPAEVTEAARFALDAIKAHTSIDWECNSDHPKLHAAMKRLEAALGGGE